jgi:hypothetical protein
MAGQRWFAPLWSLKRTAQGKKVSIDFYSWFGFDEKRGKQTKKTGSIWSHYTPLLRFKYQEMNFSSRPAVHRPTTGLRTIRMLTHQTHFCSKVVYKLFTYRLDLCA